MKTLMTATGLALLLLLPLQLTVQSQTNDTEANSGSTAQDMTEAAWERRIPEINFENILFFEAVQLLGNEFQEINFVTEAGIGGNVGIILHLRSVTLNEILKAIEITTSGQVRAQRMEDRLVAFYGRKSPDKPKPVLRAYNLKGYLALSSDAKSEQEVAAALENLHDVLNTSWHMLQEATLDNEDFVRPQLNVHPETRLLIAVGHPEALDVIDQVVGELTRRPAPMVDPNTGAVMPAPRW